MTKKIKSKPVFFEEGGTDPVTAATGGPTTSSQPQAQATRIKRKAGFYLSQDLLDRFNTKFYELKLADAAIENKSGLLEMALEFALDDLDQGDRSELMAHIQNRIKA